MFFKVQFSGPYRIILFFIQFLKILLHGSNFHLGRHGNFLKPCDCFQHLFCNATATVSMSIEVKERVAVSFILEMVHGKPDTGGR